MDGILPTEEFMEEELLSLTHEHKVQSYISCKSTGIWKYYAIVSKRELIFADSSGKM